MTDNTQAEDHARNAAHPLSLHDIASWDSSTAIHGEPPIRASVPALQRGLVWEPQQIELLWDSILRGFPIGALVVCPKMEAQQRGEDSRVSHHLLDGQQRCNAIALGFTDPFPENTEPQDPRDDSILWLDLNPELDRNSTRNYLTRVTTLAHPWGYKRNDDAGTVPTGGIRESLKSIGLSPTHPGYARPKPAQLFPYDSRAPIPLAWLLHAPVADAGVFWNCIATRVTNASSLRWVEQLKLFLDDTSAEAMEQREHVYRGISRATSAQILALNAPVELLEASQQERVANEGQEDISSIEHLFQRLNRQGTRLDGEELAYSMIKAYWPELADPIDRIARGRMPQARMVAIGVRAALAQDQKDRLPGVMGVSALRMIAREESDGKRKRIHEFIERRLERACSQVDQWLRYDADENPSGLLPVHLTSIALGSPDLYLLLICFAETLIEARAPADQLSKWRRPIQGLATLVHWFAWNQSRVANRVYSHCNDDLSLENIQIALREAVDQEELKPIHAPAAVDDFIAGLDVDFENWHWWKLIEGDGVEKDIATRHKNWWAFLDFRSNRELLLYAQREFLAVRFKDYDPARKDLWKAHNRPWDFDHILASKYLYNQKDGGRYRLICNQWANTIGNLRAWPFEDNRSDEALKAEEKIAGDQGILAHSFILPSEEAGFSGGHDVRHDEATARTFAETTRARLLRIYKTWYESVGIDDLIVTDKEASETIESPINPDIDQHLIMGGSSTA